MLTDVAGALSHARWMVDSRWAARVQQGHEPDEPELTSELLLGAGSRLRYVQFSIPQENRLGADWLWWFVSTNGECFGALLQAKKLKRKGNGWSVDLGYTPRKGGEGQLTTLLQTADRLKVPAGYILYCGDPSYRRGLDCGKGHQGEECDRCGRSGVTVLAGPCAKYLAQSGRSGRDIFQISRPLEDIVGPANERVLDLHLRSLDEDIRNLLSTPQVEARAVAKHFFAQAARMRLGHFRGAAAGLACRVLPGVGQIFPILPLDPGHFGLSYYEHTFRGLRSELPEHVSELVATAGLTSAPPADPTLFEGIQGVVVVEFP